MITLKRCLALPVSIRLPARHPHRKQQMKIGILEAGLIRDELADRFDPYPVMFERLLNRAGRDLQYVAFSPVRGPMPASIDECDGWLITGSRHGVYDELE